MRARALDARDEHMSQGPLPGPPWHERVCWIRRPPRRAALPLLTATAAAATTTTTTAAVLVALGLQLERELFERAWSRRRGGGAVVYERTELAGERRVDGVDEQAWRGVG